MAAIPIPISSAPGVKPQEGAGRLVNCFAEKAEQGARYPVIWRRTAGLRQVHDVVTSGHIHLRGAIQIGSTLIAPFDTRVYSVTVSGSTFSSTNLGALNGTDRVTIARNNAATPNIVCVTSAGCFNLFTGSAPTAFADADLPQPNSVSELNGYFLWTIGDGRIFASGLNAVTVATNSFTTEQSLGTLLRGVTHKGEYFAFGQHGCGVYTDIGASPFPLQRQKFTIDKGIVGTHAIAGWEDGWIGDLSWVAPDGIVYKLTGYTPEPVGNDDVTRAIQAAILAGDGDQLEASVYMQGRHAMWQLTYPGVWTWERNATTGNWHERESYGRDDCRASCTVSAFDRWIAGDRTTGKLFQIDESYYREATDPLVFEIVTGCGANFPNRVGIPRADFDFTTAVGVSSGEDPIQTDPVVQIAWSLDGGYRYGNPVTRALGAEGKSKVPITVRPIGTTAGKGVRYRLRVSDPVHVAFMGGDHPGMPRAA